MEQSELFGRNATGHQTAVTDHITRRAERLVNSIVAIHTQLNVSIMLLSASSNIVLLGDCTSRRGEIFHKPVAVQSCRSPITTSHSVTKYSTFKISCFLTLSVQNGSKKSLVSGFNCICVTVNTWLTPDVVPHVDLSGDACSPPPPSDALLPVHTLSAPLPP